MVKRKILVIVIIGIVISLILGIGLTGEDFETKKAEEYYEEHGEIISKINANNSDNVQTESMAIAEMHRRGFKQYPTYYDSAMGGEFEKDREVSKTSVDKHPSYKTYYITEKGALWTISIINGSVTAYPVNEEVQTAEVETMISEKDSIACYDIETNTFYEVIPDSDTVKLVTVDNIDSETLDSLTKEDIS